IHRKRPAHRRAFDILHDEIVLADIMQRADVRMIQARDGLRLALEALAEWPCDDLDRDGSVEPRIGGPVDSAHAASADWGFNPVWSEGAPENGCHGDFILSKLRARALWILAQLVLTTCKSDLKQFVSIMVRLWSDNRIDYLGLLNEKHSIGG